MVLSASVTALVHLGFLQALVQVPVSVFGEYLGYNLRWDGGASPRKENHPSIHPSILRSIHPSLHPTVHPSITPSIGFSDYDDENVSFTAELDRHRINKLPHKSLTKLEFVFNLSPSGDSQHFNVALNWSTSPTVLLWSAGMWSVCIIKIWWSVRGCAVIGHM